MVASCSAIEPSAFVSKEAMMIVGIRDPSLGLRLLLRVTA